jgi:hypothetical protein
MRHRRLRHGVLPAACLAAVSCLAGAGCSRNGPAAAPVQLVTGPSSAPAATAPAAAPGAPGAVADGVIAFPPRNEPFAFREELERKYRDGLRRSPSPTFVDVEGDIVWTQEYLRYRVNECSHDVAMQRVFAQIDGQGILPVCGSPPPRLVPFPPRNEPYAFRQELERKYRDGLRRNAAAAYVDIEGAVVWTQEYLRYRVNRCGHEAATQKVLDQIDGKGVAPVCTDGPTGIWDGTSSYFNAPFSMDMWLNGNALAGRYTDRHDIGYIGGTYAGGSEILILVNFGDTGIAFDGEFDGPDRIRGTIRGGVIGGAYPFVMTRRP